MYNIRVELYFSSAHYLRGYKGKCEDLHGHNWKVEVTVEAKEPDKIGLVMD
ncbi:MAG: 6-carboxytetrahydropterin synthase, partial [Candidatus Omnitrophica bacterium]|nr:6-carboxytetrahydropterin synthase [Candidatus Omnitrophota bacterium]